MGIVSDCCYTHSQLKSKIGTGRITMARIEITFHNKIGIRTLAQIFVEQTLISTGVADPGESCTLSAESGDYDIYFKNGMTGWELTRKLGVKAKRVTLSERKGRYVVK